MTYLNNSTLTKHVLHFTQRHMLFETKRFIIQICLLSWCGCGLFWFEIFYIIRIETFTFQFLHLFAKSWTFGWCGEQRTRCWALFASLIWLFILIRIAGQMWIVHTEHFTFRFLHLFTKSWTFGWCGEQRIRCWALFASLIWLFILIRIAGQIWIMHTGHFTSDRTEMRLEFDRIGSEIICRRLMQSWKKQQTLHFFC